MRIKKILSLAVVLAMVLTVVPMFGISASAAEGRDFKFGGVWYTLSPDNLVYNGDFSDVTTGDDGVTTVKGWTAGYIGKQLQELNTKEFTNLWECEGMKFTYTPAADGISAYVTTPVKDPGQTNNYSYDPGNANGDCYSTFHNWFKTKDGADIQAEKGKYYYLSFKTKASALHNGEQWVNFGAFSESGEKYKTVNPGRFDLGEFVNTAVMDNYIKPAKWITEIDKWVTVETVAYAKENGYFAFQAAWEQDYGTESFTDFVIKEATPIPSDASVKVSVKDENNDEIFTDTIDNLYTEEPFTYNKFIVDKEGTKYQPAKGQTGVSTIEALKPGENNIEFKFAKVDGYKEVTVPETAIVDHDKYTVANKNLVENPTFETNDGRFTPLAWNSSQTNATIGGDNGADHAFATSKDGYTYINGSGFVESEDFAPQDGDYAFGGRYNDSETGLCSIYQNVKVGTGKTVYVSFWAKAYDDNAAYVSVQAVASDATASKSDNPITLTKSNAGDWTHFEQIVTTDAEKDTVQINAYKLGNGNNAGSQPYFLFDNFVVAEAAVAQAGEDVTVTFKNSDQQEVLKKVQRIVKGEETFTVPEQLALYDGKLYSIPETEVEDNKEITVEIAENAVIPSATFFYNFKTGERISDFGGDHGDTKNSSNMASVGWGAVRGGVMAFDGITAPQAGKAIIANLHVNAPYNWGDATFYAVNPEKLNAGNYKFDYDGSSLVDGNASEEIPKVLTALGATEAIAKLSGATGSLFMDIDLNPYFAKYPEADKVVLVMVSTDGQTYVYGNDTAVFNTAELIPYVTYEYADIPTAPTASLGWNGTDFTVNFAVEGEPATIKVTPEGGEAKEFTEATGVIIDTPNTNRIYTAVVKDVVESAQVQASVYSLVVKEILAEGEGEVSAERIEKANEVIAKGGMVFDEALTEETSGIMTLSEGKTSITINEAAKKIGVGFVLNGGTLYVGSADKTATAEEEGTVFGKLTITETGVELSEAYGAETQEAVVLSLDSVNIEFVETLIDALESDGADAEAELEPVL